MSYELEKEIIVLTNKTVNILLKENPDSLALYIFYIQASKRQKTNQVFTTNNFCRKGLGFSRGRLQKSINILVKYKLIERLQQRERGRFVKHYIKINYLWKKASLKEVNQMYEKPQVVSTTSGEMTPNALSKDTRNALSKKREGRAKITSQIYYLSEIPKEDVREFCTKFKVLPGELRSKGESLHDYCTSKGKTYKNYKSLLRNAVRKDFGIRNDAPGMGDVIW